MTETKRAANLHDDLDSMPELATVDLGLDGEEIVMMQQLKIVDPTSGVDLITTEPFVGIEEAKEAVVNAFTKLEKINKAVLHVVSLMKGDIPHYNNLEFGMDKATESGIIRGPNEILHIGKSLDYKHIFGILTKHNVTFESSGQIFIKPCYINLEVLSPEEKRRHATEIANIVFSLEE